MSKVVPSLPITPIYWERTGEEPVRIVDLRTLPEDVKVAIISAAMRVTRLYENGQLDGISEGSNEEESLDWLAEEVAAVTQHMHEVPLLVDRT